MKYTGTIVIVLFFLIVVISAKVYGYINFSIPASQIPIFGMVVLFASWIFGRQYDQLKFLSEKDALTELYNRRYMIKAFPKLAASAKRKNEKLLLYFIDSDDFKTINDTRGHEIGDQILNRIAKSIG